MLSIAITTHSAAHILALSGPLDDAGGRRLQQALDEVRAKAAALSRPLLLDLSDVPRITPRGMEPVRAEASARAAAGGAPLLAAHGPAPQECVAAPTLGEHFANASIGAVIALFDHVFARTLAPWYVGCVTDEVRPFRLPAHHAPDTLPEAAAEALGPDLDEGALACPELERDLPNPFRFLACEAPRRAAFSRPWPVCVCHNRLGLDVVRAVPPATVLLAGLDAAGPADATADFARLEVDLLVRMPRLSDDRDARDLARFMDRWLSAATFRDIPRHQYSGTDLSVIKAFEVMRRLRARADRLTAAALRTPDAPGANASAANDENGRTANGTAVSAAPDPAPQLAPYLTAGMRRAAHLAADHALAPERRRMAAVLAALAAERLGARPEA
ncbi:MAG: hypothetical protein H0S85_04050 [Desulfovibrionaceae bacterium]|jgi:hypothetical protein|nr:hypothetical protein [Desulfovibrionaceae bacterium]